MKKARIWIGIVISIIALAIAFRKIDLSQVWAAITRVNYWFLAASLLPLLLFVVLRAYRWRLLFYPKQGLRIRNLLAVINHRLPAEQYLCPPAWAMSPAPT